MHSNETDSVRFTETTQIRRDAQGRWFHDGVQIRHTGIARAFDRWLERDGDGGYRLRNAPGAVGVPVDGPPLSIRSVDIAGDRVRLHIAEDETEPLDVSTLRIAEDGSFWCEVRASRIPARFGRA